MDSGGCDQGLMKSHITKGIQKTCQERRGRGHNSISPYEAAGMTARHVLPPSEQLLLDNIQWRKPLALI
jgi:hypothetical protein